SIARDPLSAHPICTRSAALGRLVDPPNVSCGSVRTVRRVVHGTRAPTGLACWIPGRHVAGVVRRVEAPAYGHVRQPRVLLVCRIAGARDQHRRRRPGRSKPDARQVSSAPTPSSQLTDRFSAGSHKGDTKTRTRTNMKVRL